MSKILFSKKFEKEFEKNIRFYSELAEKRTIESLGLSEKEVIVAKVFESTKARKLRNIKHEMLKEQNEKLTVWKVLFGSFD